MPEGKTEEKQKSICLYLHAHQPFRLTHLNYLQLGELNDYFKGSGNGTNKAIIDKVAHKSYLPTNKILTQLAEEIDDFHISLSITGVLIEQLLKFAPDVLESFKRLVATGKVEIVHETYYHSLASIYSLEEFCEQVTAHRNLIKSIFNIESKVFRNTELIYDDYIASIVRQLGYEVIIAEGWDKFLGWRNSNHVYRANTEKITGKSKNLIDKYAIGKPAKELKLLLKNYKLSDDIAFRFSDKGWVEHPLSVKKYLKWLEDTEGEIINLFMDYETFGEHQWEDTGIFKFLKKLPKEAKKHGITFKTISQAAQGKAKDTIEVKELTSWADLERDISAWRGNKMQELALGKVYDLQEKLNKLISKLRDGNKQRKYLEYWRKLQISDHFYYMSTKYWSDGDVHTYFSPYDSPYDAFINYMNILEDFEQKLEHELNAKKKKN